MRLMITGPNSMVGKAVIEQYKERKDVEILPVYHHEFDLTSSLYTQTAFTKFKPTHVINLAGFNGGISLNAQKPAEIFRINTQIALNVLNVAQQKGVKKLLSLIPSCSYPDIDGSGQGELSEADYYKQKPHDSVACHGLAKRTLVAYSEMLNKQYGCNFVTVCCNTIYGPHDNFSENGKVMSSLIKKIIEAKNMNLPQVTIWGSGEVYRGFIYCKDAARAIVECMDKYNDSTLPLNIESQEISIIELANLIKDIIQYDGKIIPVTSKPDGQKRKMLDFSKSKDIINYRPKYNLAEGIAETVDWCYKNCAWANIKS